MTAPPTALIADDEPLLRDALQAQLAQAWPELRVVAQARNGREAIAQFEALRPDACFLDVQMPGISGVDAARAIGRRAHLVFVTAFDQYALQAFEAGALDYLVKPVEGPRLADTVQRLQARLQANRPAAHTEALIDQLARHLQRSLAAGTPAQHGAAPLRWIRAAVGGVLRLIAVEDVAYLRADTKYTLVAWRGDGGQPGEALLNTPLKDVLAQLDARMFVQVHRSVVVNLAAVSHVTRGENETAHIHLKGRGEVLPVSRTYLHLFRPT